MAIASIEFGVLSTDPTPPTSGKKLFLGAGDVLKTVDSSGSVALVEGSDIVEYPSRSTFPSVGRTNRIYMAMDTSTPWRWSSSSGSFVLFNQRIDAGIYP
jgi:hypothetical protein